MEEKKPVNGVSRVSILVDLLLGILMSAFNLLLLALLILLVKPKKKKKKLMLRNDVQIVEKVEKNKP